jgi:hypothetical protein
MRKKARLILRDVRKQVGEHGVKLVIDRKPKCWIEYELCDGYFKAPSKTRKGILVIAVGKKRHVDYMWDLAHEIAHFHQWLRKDKLWKKYNDNESLYYQLEKKTEREAEKIFESWGFRSSERLRKRSQKYLKTLEE